MDDLDLLKKDWQKPNAFEQVSEKQIYEMLHKKSSSIVKWLLIISFLEFGFWTVMNLLLDTGKNFKNKEHLFYVKIFEYFSYAVIIVFIYLLFLNYKKISSTVSTKQLMIDILKTKKIVNYYVFYNLIMAFFAFFTGIVYVFCFTSENKALLEKLTNNSQFLVVFIIIMIVVVGIILVVFWLFYKLLYGVLLKKLYTNYEELKKIDL